MTNEIDETGPGVEDWRSAKFAATVDGVASYFYAVTETTNIPSAGWSSGDTVEQSWLTYGADATTTVVVSHVDLSPITSAIIYPGDAGVEQSIADGDLTLTVPAGVRVRVEVNNDRGEGSFSLFSNPLKPTVPDAITDFSELVQSATVNLEESSLTVTGHGLSTGDLIYLHTTGDMPTTSAGTLARYKSVSVLVLDANTVTLYNADSDSDVDIALAEAGTGTFTICPAEWTDTESTLYFGQGEHQTGILFALANGANVYIDVGAVVDGSWDFTASRYLTGGAHITGPGMCVLQALTAQGVAALGTFAEKLDYVLFNGSGKYNQVNDSTISGVVCASFPYYLSISVVRHFDRVKAICPHWYSTDGTRTSAASSSELENGATSCYMLVGDDAFHLQGTGKTYTDCFAAISSNACFHGVYWPEETEESTTQVVDCHALHFGLATGSLGADTIFKSLIDESETNSALMQSGIAIRGLKVWGPLIVQPFAIGNIPYPFGTSRGLRGQLFNWIIEDLWFQHTPSLLGYIQGYNTENRPHDITFTNMTVAYEAVDATNFRDFVDVDQLTYNLWVNGVLMDARGHGNQSATFYHQEGKTNPYPPGFNYPNHYGIPTSYQPFEGPGLLGSPRIGIAPGLALQMHEHLGETVYVAQCGIEDSGVGVKTVYPDDEATTPYAWLDAKMQQSWAPSSGGAYSRMEDVIASTVAALDAESNTGDCAGVFWVGGQEDASYENMADNYFVSCGTLIREMRKAIKAAELFSGPASTIPFVHAKVASTYTYAATVNAAIMRLSLEDPYMACYEVDDLTLMADGTSFDGAGQSLASERAYAAFLSLKVPSTSKVEICNMALANIGDGATVTSIDPLDGSQQARVCAQFFDIALNKAMEAHNWDFASKRTSPTAIATDRTEWLFSYALPTDYTGVITVLPEGATDDDNLHGASIREPYAVAVDAMGVKRLYTNAENCLLIYKTRVADSSQWSDSFVIYLSWVLASMIAPPQIKGDKGMEASKMALQMAKFHLAEASTWDVQTTREKPQKDDLAEWDRLSR